MIFRICIVFIRAEKALYVFTADYNLHHYTIEYNNNMSNFELEKNINNTDKIVYNYPRVSINKNEITSTATQLNMTFYNSSQDPNIIYTKGGENIVYNHTRAYFSPLIHDNIKGLTVDQSTRYGELVIEHTNPSSGNKLYVCILLELFESDETNAMDTMIQFKSANSTGAGIEGIELNSVIPTQDNGIIYDSIVNNITSTVVVLTKPIRINNTSKARVNNLTALNRGTPILLDKYRAAYTVLPRTGISIPDADKIYISCNPTGESEENIRTYNVPINSDTGTEEDAKTAMYTVNSFAVFTMMTMFLIFFVPGAYKAVVMSGITDVNQMRAVDLILMMIFLGEIIASFILAFTSEGNYILFYIGGFFALMLFESISILYVKKMDTEYITPKSTPLDFTNSTWGGAVNALPSVLEQMISATGLQELIGMIVPLIILLVLASLSDSVISWSTFSILLVPFAGLGAVIAHWVKESQ